MLNVTTVPTGIPVAVIAIVTDAAVLMVTSGVRNSPFGG
jgi:nickel-dependent lactate racemase